MTGESEASFHEEAAYQAAGRGRSWPSLVNKHFTAMHHHWEPSRIRHAVLPDVRTFDAHVEQYPKEKEEDPLRLLEMAMYARLCVLRLSVILA